MKSKKILWLALLLVAFAAMAGGGCGGSSSRSGIKTAEDLLVDGGGLVADAAGLMTIFSIPGLDPAAVFEATLGNSGFVKGQEIRMIPSMVYRPLPGGRSSGLSAAAEDDEEDLFDAVSSDVYRLVGLKANVRYTVEISENRAEPLMAMPVIQLRKWGDKGTETRSDSGTVTLVEDQTLAGMTKDELEKLSESEIKAKLIADSFSEEEAAEIAKMIANGETGTNTEPMYAVTISDPHLGYDLSAYPEEDPGIIAATFVAPSAGDYELSIAGMEGDGYLLCIYEERGDATTGYGYPEIIRYEDGSLFTVDDQITLRLAVLEYDLHQELEIPEGFDITAPEADEKLTKLYKENCGDPSKYLDEWGLPDPKKISAKGVRAAADDDDEIPTPGGAYDKAAERLTPAKGQRSTIPLEVNDIRRIPKFNMTMGDTYDGVTALKKSSHNTSGRAVEFDEAWKENTSIEQPSAASRVKLITTEREHEEEMEVTTTAGVELAKFSIENKNRVQKSMKYGLTSATLLLKYVVADTKYKTPDGGFELSEGAADYLEQNGSSAFRKEYGDYFVSGVKYGGRFEAMITITAETREKMKEIENKVNTQILAFSASNEFSKKLKDTLANTTIEITIYEEGGSANSEGAVDLGDKTPNDLIESMMKKFNDFVAESKRNDFKAVPVFYQLTRLRSLNRNIDDQIDVSPKALLASRNLLRTMMGVDAYYNVLDDIPTNNLVNASSLRSSWVSLHRKQEIAEAELHDIFTSVEKMDAKRSELEKIRDDFRVMSERWSFYKALLAEQKRFRVPGLDHNYGGVESHLTTQGLWSWGLNDYSFSPAVHENFKEVYPEPFTKPWKLWSSYQWEPRISGTATKMVAWHQVRDRCYCNWIKNVANHPTVGSHSISWSFDGKGSRKVDWFWQVRWFEMKPAEFPFRGLEG